MNTTQHTQEAEDLYVCDACGSDDVDVECMVNINTRIAGKSFEDGETYCNQCQAPCVIVHRTEVKFALWWGGCEFGGEYKTLAEAQAETEGSDREYKITDRSEDVVFDSRDEEVEQKCGAQACCDDPNCADK